MRQRSRKETVFVTTFILLTVTLACNLPTPRVATTFTPEVVTIVVTATEPQPAVTQGDEPAMPTPTSESPGNGSSSGAGGGDGDVFASISVKDGEASFEGQISFPGTDSSDEIYVKPVGFNSTVTSGVLIFSLTCTGEENAKVNYKGGAIESGSPGCGETWRVSVVSGSADSHITVRLDDSGEVDWVLSVTGGQ